MRSRTVRSIALPGAIAAALLAVPASAQSFVGEWRATAKTRGGDVSETLSVKKAGKGYSITARNVSPAPPRGSPVAGPGTSIKLNGNAFSYRRVLTFDGKSVEIVYSGVVSGNTFKGTVSIAGFSAPYNGVRVRK